MQTVQLDEKDITGLIFGLREHRLKLMNNDAVIKSFDIDFFKSLIDKGNQKEEKFWDFDDINLYEIIEMLQILAYNRHKTKDSEKTADFVFDFLFELIADGEWK